MTSRNIVIALVGAGCAAVIAGWKILARRTVERNHPIPSREEKYESEDVKKAEDGIPPVAGTYASSERTYPHEEDAAAVFVDAVADEPVPSPSQPPGLTRKETEEFEEQPSRTVVEPVGLPVAASLSADVSGHDAPVVMTEETATSEQDEIANLQAMVAVPPPTQGDGHFALEPASVSAKPYAQPEPEGVPAEALETEPHGFMAAKEEAPVLGDAEGAPKLPEDSAGDEEAGKDDQYERPRDRQDTSETLKVHDHEAASVEGFAPEDRKVQPILSSSSDRTEEVTDSPLHEPAGIVPSIFEVPTTESPMVEELSSPTGEDGLEEQVQTKTEEESAAEAGESIVEPLGADGDQAGGEHDSGGEALAPTFVEAQEDGIDLDGEDGAEDQGNLHCRSPRRYRPVASTPTRPGPVGRTERSGSGSGERNRALRIEIRAIERRGYFKVSLLPQRTDGMPETVATQGMGNPGELIAMQEEWYQDVVPDGLGDVLRHGMEWEPLKSRGRIKWSLRGRDVFVLSGSDMLSGFVGVPRLVLGEKHLVLCAEEILGEVEEAIRLTGSPPPLKVGPSDGMPAGWMGLKGVLPRDPVAPSPEGNILDSLCPQPQFEIVFSGGIRLERSSWLAGYPPRIHLRGDHGRTGDVMIDGLPAALSDDGSLTAPGWDGLGEHTVWCIAGSRTYRIQEGIEEWPAWAAHSWSLGESEHAGEQDRSTICGGLVMPATGCEGQSYPVLVPTTNTVLLGPVPGQVFTCNPRHDLSAHCCSEHPPFQPVWALPANPYRCDKNAVRILRIGEPIGVRSASGRMSKKQKVLALAWAGAVLNASRKGLRTDSSDPAAETSWAGYKRHAHTIWRSLK